MSETMITVRDVKKAFSDDAGALEVLKGVSLTIDKGEMVGLLGISGAGKTTLLQIMGGLDRPASGQVLVEGRDIAKLPSAELSAFRNLKIGFVFQFHHLLPDFSALENVMIPGMIAGKPRSQCEQRGRELLNIFGLDRCRSHFPTQLSGGERQRVALARALANNPALVLADEPTGNLDRHNGEILLDYFRRANLELQQTFLIATHNNQLAEGMHRSITIEDGKVLGDL